MKNQEQKIEEAVRITQELAQELKRTPLKLELMRVINRYTIDTYVGGYDKLLSLAGLTINYEAQHEPRLAPTNEMFRRELPELVNKEILSHAPTMRGLIGGDMHLPWVHKPTLERFHAFNKDMQPDYVLQIGDLFDMYSHARFPKSQNLYTPKDEEYRAKAMAVEFWQRIHQDNPKAERIQLLGNHDIRPVKQTLTHLPSIEHFVEAYMENLFKFEGVKTINDHREIFRLDGIAFHHGYLGKIGDHRDAVIQNMVVGHTHLGGVSYRGIYGGTIWELNAGLMGDPSSKVMSYTPTKENKWTLGFGYIDEFGPRFIAT